LLALAKLPDVAHLGLRFVCFPVFAITIARRSRFCLLRILSALLLQQKMPADS